MVKLGRRVLAGALLIAGAGSAWAQPKPQSQPQPQQGASQPAQIDRNGVLILIRTTLLALSQANETGNYTVLRDLSAPGFRDANTAARLAEIFAGQRAQKLDLSGVAVLDPQLTLLPQIETSGLLHMAGFFPSVPSQVNFELLFAPVEGRWRPIGIAVNLGSSTPAAPMPASAPQSQATMPVPPSKPDAAKPKPIPRRSVVPAEKSNGAIEGQSGSP